MQATLGMNPQAMETCAPMQGPHSHPAAEELRAFAEGQLSRADRRRVARHLIRGCQACTAEVESFERQPVRDGLDEMIGKVYERLGTIQERVEGERWKGEALFENLLRHPPHRRRMIVQSSRRYASPGLLEVMLREYQRVEREPREGLELAKLAITVAEQLEPLRGSAWVEDLQARALGVAGNAARMGLDVALAAVLLAKAEERLGMGSGDPLAKAEILGYEGSLFGDIRAFRDAERAFRRAGNLYRKVGELHRAARMLVLRAEACGTLVPEAGIQLARRALREIRQQAGQEHDPHLELSARHILAWCLEAAGRPQAARTVMEAAAPFYRLCAGDALVSIHRVWLEGRIHMAVHETWEARQSLERVSAGVEELGLPMIWAMVGIDRAALAALIGHHAEAARRLMEVAAHARACGVPPELCAAVEVLRAAVEARRAQRASFRRTAVTVWCRWPAAQGAE